MVPLWKLRDPLTVADPRVQHLYLGNRDFMESKKYQSLPLGLPSIRNLAIAQVQANISKCCINPYTIELNASTSKV